MGGGNEDKEKGLHFYKERKKEKKWRGWIGGTKKGMMEEAGQ